MKKRTILFALLLVFCLLLSFTSFAEIDLSAMSYDELLVLQKQISLELRAKEPVDGKLIYDKDGIKVIYQGLKTKFHTGAQFLIENASKKNIGVSFESVSVNDFMMSTLFSKRVSAGKKAMDTLDFMYLDDYSISEIDTIELSVKIFDAETFMNIDVSDPVVIIP